MLLSTLILYIGDTSSSLCARGSSSTSAGGRSRPEFPPLRMNDDVLVFPAFIEGSAPLPERCVYAMYDSTKATSSKGSIRRDGRRAAVMGRGSYFALPLPILMRLGGLRSISFMTSCFSYFSSRACPYPPATRSRFQLLTIKPTAQQSFTSKSTGADQKWSQK